MFIQSKSTVVCLAVWLFGGDKNCEISVLVDAMDWPGWNVRSVVPTHTLNILVRS
jgi:hypothetical protein